MPSTKPAWDFQGLWMTETDKQVTQTCGAQLRSLSLCGIPRVPHLTSSRLCSKAQICCRLCVHDAKHKSEGRFSGAGQLKQCSQHPFLKIISWEFLKISPSVRREASVQLYQWGSWVQMAEQMSCKHTESLRLLIAWYRLEETLRGYLVYLPLKAGQSSPCFWPWV